MPDGRNRSDECTCYTAKKEQLALSNGDLDTLNQTTASKSDLLRQIVDLEKSEEPISVDLALLANLKGCRII